MKLSTCKLTHYTNDDMHANLALCRRLSLSLVSLVPILLTVIGIEAHNVFHLFEGQQCRIRRFDLPQQVQRWAIP